MTNSTNHLKFWALKGCTSACILSESVPALIVTSPINQVASPVLRIPEGFQCGPVCHRRGGWRQ